MWPLSRRVGARRLRLWRGQGIGRRGDGRDRRRSRRVRFRSRWLGWRDRRKRLRWYVGRRCGLCRKGEWGQWRWNSGPRWNVGDGRRPQLRDRDSGRRGRVRVPPEFPQLQRKLRSIGRESLRRLHDRLRGREGVQRPTVPDALPEREQRLRSIGGVRASTVRGEVPSRGGRLSERSVREPQRRRSPQLWRVRQHLPERNLLPRRHV
jgi:hypothetical protein